MSRPQVLPGEATYPLELKTAEPSRAALAGARHKKQKTGGASDDRAAAQRQANVLVGRKLVTLLSEQ